MLYYHSRDHSLTGMMDMIILASSDFIRMGSLLVSFFVEGVSCQFVLTIIFKHSTHTLKFGKHLPTFMDT